MAEFPASSSFEAVLSFSDGTKGPLENLRMDHMTDEQLINHFRDKTILDIGSGYESLARRLYQLFKTENEEPPAVINLNPQFVDTAIGRRSEIITKNESMLRRIKINMNKGGEDFEGYMAQRLAVAGMVQKLPFNDCSIDIATSIWAYPRTFFETGLGDKHFQAGADEILRVLKVGGVAHLTPITSDEYPRILHCLSNNSRNINFTIARREGTPLGDVLDIRRLD